MPERSATQLATALVQFADFLDEQSFAPPEHLSQLRQWAAECQATSAVPLTIVKSVDALRGELYSAAREQIWGGRYLPGHDETSSMDALNDTMGELTTALYPPSAREDTDVDITGFAGADEVQHKLVPCYGNTAHAREVVERSLAFAKQYAGVLATGDYQTAYQLLERGFQAEMPLEKFTREQQAADNRYGGGVARFQAERFAYILSDEAARAKVKLRPGGWPRAIPKQNCRSRILGFWVRNIEKNSGCYGSIWIAEENGGYCLAGFDYNRG